MNFRLSTSRFLALSVLSVALGAALSPLFVGRALAKGALAKGAVAPASTSTSASSPASLSGEQVIVAVRAALAAKPGRIVKMKAEIEDGATLCELRVLAANGKSYTLDVNAATGKVKSVVPYSKKKKAAANGDEG